MKLLLDTNIIFSALLNPSGKIAEIILNPSFQLKKYGCYFSYIELFKHKEKIIKLSKLEETDLLDVMYKILKEIEFVNEKQLTSSLVLEAYELTKNIDENNTIYIAMSHFLDCKLWTGDKKLAEGLHKKNYYNCLSTEDLLKVLNNN